MTIIDFKTSTGIYHEAALQLAALWGATIDKDRAPVPHSTDGVTDLIVVRIGTDGFEEKTVANPAGSFEAFLALRTAWEWKYQPAYVEDVR